MMEQSDEMSDDQPCQELQPYNIFTPDVLADVKDLYLPIFEKIRIFGNVDNPVFVAKDVQDALGLKDLHYSRDGLWEWDVDKIKIKIKTAAGLRPAIAFTEQGLYMAIWHSKTETAKKFRTFMTCVMKRLRMTGSVTMEEAIADTKAKLAKAEGTLRAWSIQMDEEHKSLMHYKHEHDNLVLSNQDYLEALEKAKLRLECQRDPNVGELKDRLRRVMERTGRAIYIMLSKPPKEHEGSHEYNLNDYSEFDEDMIDPSDVMVYSIGLSTLESKVAIKKVYVHKTVKLDDVHKALASRLLEKLDKDGNGTGTYKNMYEASLDHMDMTIDDLNRKDEEAQAKE